ncbi:sigma-70 family RNA polymerase sigma factor [Clostridium ihumii]|uniref:sigma-70 family RNA polymerase sigma factor n=1 Tax=Clostridium ihumii TaxID=1470356 RepID=UPI0005912278|nr:sigma-70 family RNA polymerase sigma factor [Clostridium ihumii]
MSKNFLFNYLDKNTLDKKSYEDLNELVCKAKVGNDDCKLELMNLVTRYIHKLSKSSFIPDSDKEDFVMIGYLSVLNSIKKFSPDKGDFVNYAIRSIKFNFYDNLRINKYNSTVSLSTEIDDGLTLEDVLASPESSSNVYMRDDINLALHSLTDEEKKLFYHCIIKNDFTLMEYAKFLGVDYRHVLYLKNKALSKMKKFLK